MKRIINSFCLGLVLSCTTIVSGQKILTNLELDEIVVKSVAFQDNVPHRTTSELETFNYKGSRPLSRYTFTTISIPSKSSHYISIFESDIAYHKIEQILIGQTIYEKENYGPWQIQPKATPVQTTAAKRLEKGIFQVSQTVYFFEHMAKEELFGEIADLYARTTRFTAANDHGGKVYSVEEKYWINENRILLKIVKESYSQDFKTFMRLKTTYDFDACLEVKPPIK